MVPSTTAWDLFQPSADRLDNKKGYYQDNVVLVCWAANAARGISSPEQFKLWLDAMNTNYSPNKAS